MGRSKAWHVPFSQIVPVGHSSSLEQTAPVFSSPLVVVVVVAVAVAVVVVVVVVVAVVVVVVVVAVAVVVPVGSSSAWAVRNGDNPVGPRLPNGSRLAPAQPDRGIKTLATQVAANRSR